MKTWLQRKVRQYGYEVRKAPQPKFASVDVLDLAIAYLFATTGKQLTFIEVGANDGKSIDPLHDYIVKYKWRGVLVEPQPDVFDRLKENYAAQTDHLTFENVAVSSDPNPIHLFRAPYHSIGQATQVSSDPKITAKMVGLRQEQLEKIKVPTMRLDDLIAKHNLNPLHLLLIDTEGHEWEVLKSLDLKKTRPRIIGFEHGHLSPALIATITKHLNDHDYDLHFGGYESDSVALPRDFILQD